MVRKQNILLIVLALLLVACTSPTAKTDADTLTPDGDELKADLHEDKEWDDTIPIKELENSFDDEALSDDSLTDESLPDEDIDMFCPKPHEAKYPYFRNDGTIHFCRPCDTPVKEDPQCISSLWDYYAQYVNNTYKAGDPENRDVCYPYPCVWNKKPFSNEEFPEIHPCKIIFPPDYWQGGGQVERSVFIENGKVLFFAQNGYMEHPDWGTFDYPLMVEYDLMNKTLSPIAGGSYQPTVLEHGLYMFSLSAGSENSMVILAEKTETGLYRFATAFPGDEKYPLFKIYNRMDPAFNDKWILVSYEQRLSWESGDYVTGTVYAERNEWGKWIWHKLHDSLVVMADIQDDAVVFINWEDNNAYYCNLSIYPSSLADCKQINPPNEIVADIHYDHDLKGRIYYAPVKETGTEHDYIVLDVINDTFVFQRFLDFPDSTTDKQSDIMAIQRVRGDLILYAEDLGNYARKYCFYRLDKEKAYCRKTYPQYVGDLNEIKGDFEGKWSVSNSYQGSYSIVDWECICQIDGADSCPFDEYLP